LTLDAFMARYVACRDESQKHRALEAAWAVLSRPLSQEEPLLNLNQISERLGVDPCTAWRWRLPWREWRGVKRYLVSECEAYLESDNFRKRRQELSEQRPADPEQDSGVGCGVQRKSRGRPSSKALPTSFGGPKKKDHLLPSP
jgi:hypothetical protein